MKHNVKVTILILVLFIIAQFIGLYVTNHYADGTNVLPLGLNPERPQTAPEYYSFLFTVIFSFICAIILFFILTKWKIESVLRIWLLLVVTIALSVSIGSILSLLTKYFLIFSFLIATTLAILKIYQRNFILHNLTELIIYPGVAAVFVPILNPYTMLALLILISIYDM